MADVFVYVCVWIDVIFLHQTKIPFDWYYECSHSILFGCKPDCIDYHATSCHHFEQILNDISR